MKKLAKYLRPFKWSIILVFVLTFADTIAVLTLPAIMAVIVDQGIIRGVVENTPQTAFVVRMGLIMLVVALAGGLATVCASYLTPRISAGAARNLRRDLFVKVESFSQTEFDSFSASSLITRSSNDVTQVQNLINSTRLIIFAPAMGIGGIIMALQQSVAMSWIIALAVLTLLSVSAVIIPVAMPRFRLIQGMMDKLNKLTRETLHGLMVIRAFSTQKHEMERFDKNNVEITAMNLFLNRLMAVTWPLMTLIMSGTQMLVVWVGAGHIAESGLQIGDMMAFMSYAASVIFAFMMITMVTIQIPRAMVSAGRIVEVLDTEPVINDPLSPAEFDPSKQGVVSFDNVSFKYPGAEANALSNISFTALPGKTTAIIGSTGAGKSSIAHLISRLYDVTGGSISVCGVDIRNVKQGDLRMKIGYVPQKGQLISGTIASNISYGRLSATDDEIINAAEVAQASDFINEKAEGIEAEIGQKGGNVSGGQRQRLSIARALAKNPEILVFDDSFSALDFRTDVELRRALKEYAAQAAIIVIAQRVGTIRNADQILVLENGEIVGRGTHDELMASCPPYNEIALSQGVA